MRKFLLAFLFFTIASESFSQTGSLSGIVKNAENNKPLSGATVTLGGSANAVTTNSEGYFYFDKLNAGNILVEISFVGFETIKLNATIVESLNTNLIAAMFLNMQVGDEIVVSASKRPERITNAPASIQIISAKDIEKFAGSNVSELTSKVQGIEYTRAGITDITVNARGFNSAFNNKVFQLVDGRNSMSALSGSLPVMNRGSTVKDDIEKIEIVLGPQSALYGPNAHNAVFNTITKDPRRFAGTTVSVSAGNHYQFSGRFRQATKINNKWAYKLTGEYATGKEFKFNDSVYAGNQPPGAQPFFGPAKTIPERNVDFDFRHIRGEGHIYYSLTPKTDIIVSSGGSTNNWAQVTTASRNQMQGVTYQFLQARFIHPKFFANIYNTWGSLGNSYAIGNYTRDYWNITHSTLTTGPNRRLSSDSAETYALRNRFKEKSQRINAELQFNHTFKKAGLFLVAGMNYQKEKPNGFGTTLIDSFTKIRIAQYGGVIQLDKSLPYGIRLISATRFDRHDNFGSFFSPRFAAMKKIGDGNFRITWGKAYATPSIQNQYAGIGRNFFGNGDGIKYIKTNVKYSDASSIAYTTPLKPEEVSTWELGYKGTVAKKLFVDINYYNGTSENFVSPPRTVSGRVLSVNGIDVTHAPFSAGSVINDTLRNATFSTFFNYGKVRGYGIDLGMKYLLNHFVGIAVKYSWFGSDITKDNVKNDANQDGYVSLEERSMNAPRNRGAIILSLQNLVKQKLSIDLSARYVEQYDFYSSSQIGTAGGEGLRGSVYGGLFNGQPRYYLKNFDWGPLGDFVTVDLSAGYQLNNTVRLNMGVTNLLDTKQIEFVGSPSIGRLIMFEIKMHIP